MLTLKSWKQRQAVRLQINQVNFILSRKYTKVTVKWFLKGINLVGTKEQKSASFQKWKADGEQLTDQAEWRSYIQVPIERESDEKETHSPNIP